VQEILKKKKPSFEPTYKTNRTRGKDPLVNYSQFHVMTNVEYLIVMHKKNMEKASTKVIRETCHKEREENKVKKITTYFTAFEHVAIRNARANFEYNWFGIVVREVRQCLHEHL
jgi:hypothetical protein